MATCTKAPLIHASTCATQVLSPVLASDTVTECSQRKHGHSQCLLLSFSFLFAFYVQVKEQNHKLSRQLEGCISPIWKQSGECFITPRHRSRSLTASDITAVVIWSQELQLIWKSVHCSNNLIRWYKCFPFPTCPNCSYIFIYKFIYVYIYSKG